MSHSSKSHKQAWTFFFVGYFRWSHIINFIRFSQLTKWKYMRLSIRVSFTTLNTSNSASRRMRETSKRNPSVISISDWKRSRWCHSYGWGIDQEISLVEFRSNAECTWKWWMNLEVMANIRHGIYINMSSFVWFNLMNFNRSVSSLSYLSTAYCWNRCPHFKLCLSSFWPSGKNNITS